MADSVKKDVVIVCGLVSHVPEATNGSTQRACADCKAPVWVSSETRAKLRDNDLSAEFCCIPCVRARGLKEAGPHTAMPLLPVAREEARKLGLDPDSSEWLDKVLPGARFRGH